MEFQRKWNLPNGVWYDTNIQIHSFSPSLPLSLPPHLSIYLKHTQTNHIYFTTLDILVKCWVFGLGHPNIVEAIKLLRLNSKSVLKQSNKEGRAGTRFWHVLWSIKIRFSEVPFWNSICWLFINIILQCRKSFTEQIKTVSLFHLKFSLQKERNHLNFIPSCVTSLPH